MVRKLFLTDPEIRELEQMDDGTIGAHFFKLGVQKAAERVRAVIASYRISARVANAAWGFAQAVAADAGLASYIASKPNLRAELEKLLAALNDYSPGNWPPPRTEREYCAHVLERLYDIASQMTSRESALEKIYQAVEEEYRHIT